MRTRLSAWQVKPMDAEGGVMKYVSVNYTTKAHVPNDTVVYEIPFPDKVEGVLINTIRVESVENIPFVVQLMDGNSNRSIYESLEEMRFHYDQVSLPYKPSERAFFVRIHNKGGITTKFEIEIRGVEVR